MYMHKNTEAIHGKCDKDLNILRMFNFNVFFIPEYFYQTSVLTCKRTPIGYRPHIVLWYCFKYSVKPFESNFSILSIPCKTDQNHQHAVNYTQQQLHN